MLLLSLHKWRGGDACSGPMCLCLALKNSAMQKKKKKNGSFFMNLLITQGSHRLLGGGGRDCFVLTSAFTLSSSLF